jgi:uncharacterized membrane protein YhaH (DUF805 family)
MKNDDIMEQNQIPPTPTITTEPKIITEKQKANYFSRLFSGRLNRQNYIVGSTFFVLIPLICFTIVIFNILLSPDALAMPYLDPTNPAKIITPQVSIISMLQTPSNEIWSVIGLVFFILSVPYLFSMQIRRLHDLNLTSWLLLINFLPLLFVKSMFSLSELTHPDIWYGLANLLSLIAAIFSIYVSLWPGTNGVNKYGEKPAARTNFLKDILLL